MNGNPSAPAVLNFEQVHKSYAGQPVLKGLSLAVAAGEIVALLGGNGAGKSTSLRLALGLEAADSGEVRVFGANPWRAPKALRRRVSFIPETVGLYEELSARESVVYLTHVATDVRPTKAEADSALLRAGLPPAALGRTVGALSKGMRQKVCIALALCKRAELLVLDEPTSGLDIRAAMDLNCTLRELADGGVAVLLATHDLLRARELAARFCVIAGGQIVASFEHGAMSVDEIERLFLSQA
jgi:ABC-2 type transport system ATP-binding protein